MAFCGIHNSFRRIISLQLLLLVVVGSSFYFGYKTVQEYFHRADTFLGKFCI